MNDHHVTSSLCGALLAIMSAAWVAPAMAQASDESITVTGRYGPLPDSVRTLSARVSFADLDLGTDTGKDRFRRRIMLTARYLCETLGDTGAASGPATSCQDEATRNGLTQAASIHAKFAPRGTAWAPAPAWRPPYPPEWER